MSFRKQRGRGHVNAEKLYYESYKSHPTQDTGQKAPPLGPCHAIQTQPDDRGAGADTSQSPSEAENKRSHDEPGIEFHGSCADGNLPQGAWNRRLGMIVVAVVVAGRLDLWCDPFDR